MAEASGSRTHHLTRNLPEVLKRYPGTEEDRRTRAKPKQPGAAISPSR